MFSLSTMFVVTSFLLLLGQNYTQKIVISSFVIYFLPLYAIGLVCCYAAYRYLKYVHKKSK